MRSGSEVQDPIIPSGSDSASPDDVSLVEAVLAVCAGRFGLDSELEWGCLDGAGLRGAAEGLQRVIGASQHQQHRVLGLIDARNAYSAVGSRDAADWAAGRLGMSRRAAAEGIDTANKLEEFPALAAKAAAGELTPEQLAPTLDLAAAAAANGDERADSTWATHAPSMGVGALRRRAGKARRPGAADHVAARAARCFDAWRVGQELRFRGSLPVDDGATLLKAIERSMPERDPANPATLGQRQADGLLALASVTVADDADPDRATVVAIIDLAAICDDDPQATAELETGEPLATDTAPRRPRRRVGHHRPHRHPRPPTSPHRPRRPLPLRRLHLTSLPPRPPHHSLARTNGDVEPRARLLPTPPRTPRRRLAPHRQPRRPTHRHPPRRTTITTQPARSPRRHRVRSGALGCEQGGSSAVLSFRGACRPTRSSSRGPPLPPRRRVPRPPAPWGRRAARGAPSRG